MSRVRNYSFIRSDVTPYLIILKTDTGDLQEDQRLNWISRILKWWCLNVAYATLGKANRTISSVHMELNSHRTDCQEIWYLRSVYKSVGKIWVSLKSDSSLHINTYVLHISGFSENEKYFGQICIKNQNSFLFSNFLPKNRAVYKKCGRSKDTMHFHLQHRLLERATMLRHKYISCLFKNVIR